MFPSIVAYSVSIVSQPFKRSQLGLFQGKTKQYGNNVPFSKHKTRRTWLPNVQRKRLFSDTLGQDVRIKVTTRALRTIKKHGGLDNYVSKTRAEILGQEGMRIRLMVREYAEKHAANPGDTAFTKEGKADTTPVNAQTLRKEKWSPDMQSVRLGRENIMKALNMDTLPTARQTIAYLTAKKSELNTKLA